MRDGSSFDLVFLFKHFASYNPARGNVDVIPTYKDGKFLNIKIIYRVDGKKYSLNIKDSLLLLPSSLNSLAKDFGTPEQKSIFPYAFPKFSNLDYIGNVPSHKHFPSTISMDQYLNYKNSFDSGNWSLKNEVLKYCEQDCIVLYKILVKFNDLIFNHFKVDITGCVSLPSLAFKIYKTCFMHKTEEGKGTINNIGPDLYNELKASYFGGHTDMFIPAGPIIQPFAGRESSNNYLDANSTSLVSNSPSPTLPKS